MPFLRKQLTDWVHHRLRKRAELLLDWVDSSPFRITGPHLDLGCGTGHNAAEMYHRGASSITECDVVNYHMLGGEVDVFDGRTLSYPDEDFRTSSLFYALHYAKDPEAVLRELMRVTQGSLLIVQSSFQHSIGHVILNLRESFLGRYPFLLLRKLKVIPNVPCGMSTYRHFSQQELRSLFQSAGLSVRYHACKPWLGLGVNRELFVLRAEGEDA